MPPGGWPPVPPPRRPGPSRRALASWAIATFVTGLAVALAAVLLGPSKVEGSVVASETPATDATITAWLPAPYPTPNMLAPGNIGYLNQGVLGSALYTGLTSIDPATGEPQPLIADSWESEDAKTWTIHLKDGFTFHNGEAVTAESFVRSWQFTNDTDNALPGAYDLSRIEGAADGDLSGVTATDEHTLTVTMTEPWATFPRALSSPVFAPMTQDCVASLQACADTPVGNGPFILDSEWGQSVTSVSLKRWDDYAGPKPQYGGVEVSLFDDMNAAIAKIATEDVDIAQFGQEDISALGSMPNLEQSIGRSTFFLQMPDTKKYRDPKLRQAISMAIDREELYSSVARFGEAAATSFTSPALPDTVADGCTSCGFDPDQAKELLKDSDWPTDKDFEITYLTDAFGSPLLQAVCAQISDNLDIGCKLNEESDVAEYYSHLGTGDPYKTPVGRTWMAEHNSAESLYSGFVRDALGFDDSDFGTALDDWSSALDPQVAADSAANATAILDAELPVIPLGHDQTVITRSDRVAPDGLVVEPTSGSVRLDRLLVDL